MGGGGGALRGGLARRVNQCRTATETEYVFCKDNRLVLIMECLFAKASTAIALRF